MKMTKLNPQQYIKTYGGKAGGWFFLRDFGGFNLNLLPVVFLAAGEPIKRIYEQPPQFFDKQTIVRATHTNDHEGLVDVLYTSGPINEQKLIKRKIALARRRAKTPEVFAFNRYEGNPYDGKVHVMIQRYNHGDSGSIVEHPHERGTFLIDIVGRPSVERRDTRIDHVVIAGDRTINETRSTYCGQNDFMLHEIVELYKKVRETGFIDPNYSFQMEFGVNEGCENMGYVLFYQARPFLKFKEPAFDMRGNLGRYQCFGMTPPEGIVLPVVKTVPNLCEANNIDYPFAWLGFPFTKSAPLACQPRNLAAFVPIGLRINSLTHNTFRWVKKAPISILAPELTGWFLSDVQTGDQLRIISNGIESSLEEV
jgi:hypothetical protein